MSAELYSKPSPVLEQQLHSLWPLVQLVAGERYQAIQAGQPEGDTTYDRFLWGQVGQVHSGDRGEVCRQAPDGTQYVYDDAISLAYSLKGALAVVRRSSGHQSHDTNRYLVATADLPRRTITEWHVDKIDLSGHLGALCTTLLLSEHYLHPVRDDTLDDLEETFPRFALSGQGNTFFDQFGKRHLLSPIAELAQVVDYAWPALRQKPHVIESQTAGQAIAGLHTQAA